MRKHDKSVDHANIYIPFANTAGGIGGPSTFMSNLKKYLDENHFPYQNSPLNAAAIFFPIQFDRDLLKKIRKNGGRVIQRLDGIYYPSKHGEKYVSLNETIKKIYLDDADYIVFQSDYSRRQCFVMLGEKAETNYSIIVNGVHTDQFYPSSTHSRSSVTQLITSGNFRNIDMLEPIVLGLRRLQNDYPFKLHVVGPIVLPELKEYLEDDFVIFHGPKSGSEVAQLLREADIFVYSHLNPPCPNSVLEAVACGLPVVGFDSGAMRELCWFAPDLLAPVSEDIFQHYDDFSAEKLSEKISTCIDHYENYRQIALVNSSLYPFAECGKDYVDVFRLNLRNSTRKTERTGNKILEILNRAVQKGTRHQ